MAFELGRISQKEVPEITIRYLEDKKFATIIRSSLDSADFARSLYEEGELEVQEQFIVLYLSRSHRVIGYYKHSKGGLSQTVVDARLIFAAALKSLSSSMVFVHNHPSGSLKPSDNDDRITRRLKNGAELLELSVLDHIILTKESYYSYADEGLL